MLISSPIPSLFNGVSQQPASLRHTSQAEGQENIYSDIATGLRKRPPTEHIAKLSSSSFAGSYFHTINRDGTEKYTVVITAGAIYVWDFDGNAKTVNAPSGYGYTSSSNPRDDFACITIADFTFIVNKTITTAMYTGTAGGAVFGTKQSFSDLPAAAGTGQIWKIQGDPTNNFDDYYVIDDPASTTYIETIAPGTEFSYDFATMPHQLVREADGTFTFEQVSWGNRLVGDADSNPDPSFIGRTISDIFFFRNRLGMLADESFILSRPAEYFEFFIQTITAALDNDPIDADASHNKVSLLNHAMPFSKSLLLFSNETQFQVSGADTITQKNTRADPTTEFESSALCRPLSLGTELFFMQQRGEHTGMMEYYVDKDTVTNDAADTTAHVPTYVPKNVFKAAGSSTENVVALLSDQAGNELYVYKYYWRGNEKLQSSWSKFTFDVGDTIQNIDFIGQVLYLCVQRADGLYFEKMDFRANPVDTGFTFKMLLDRRKALTSGTYDAVTNTTTWTLPYPDDGTIQVVLGSTFGTSAGLLLTSTRPSSTTIRALGNYATGTVYVGRQYSKRYTFSQLFYRDEKGAVQDGRLQLQKMSVAYDKSAYFRVEVTPYLRETYTYTLAGRPLGSYTLGEAALSSGTFHFPVQTRNQGVLIEIINDSPFPSTIQSAEWVGEFVMFSQRVKG